MMTSTSLTALYLSYGLKPCRVILERLPVLEAIQTPVPAKPPKTPQTRVKLSKFRNGETRSSLSQKKPSKVASKATTRLWDPAGSPGSKEVTSEEPADKACTDVSIATCQKTGGEKTPRRSRKRRTLTLSSQVGPPLENLPRDCESEKASLSTEKEKEACNPVVATRQSEIVATKAGRSRGCRVTRSHPKGWRDATPAVDVPSCSDTFPSNVSDQSDKDRTSEEATVINQPPEIAKFLKRRHSQPSHSLPQKLQAFTPPSQACARLEELSCNHVADSGE
ncbi:uncharacterized protein LOC144161802 [Haemaphysalis longicornis]